MSISPELKEILDKQARAFESFKETNDKREQEEQKLGAALAETTEKLAKIEADFVTLREEAEEAVKASQRTERNDKEKTKEQMEYEGKFRSYLRTGEGEHELRNMRQAAIQTGSDPDGGYTVLPEMDMEIDRVVETISAIGRISKTVTIGSNKWQKPMKTSGMSMRRVADGQTGGETDNQNYALIEIEAFTAEVEPWVFNATLEDSFVDLASDLAMEAGISFAEGLGSEYAAGNGVGKARGITQYNTVANASYSWGSIGYIAAGAAGAFTTDAPGDTIINLQHSLKQQYRPGAVFVMADSTLATVRQMKDGSGAYYLWQPDPTGGFGGRLLGSPVEIDDNMPAIAANSLSIAYGNFPRSYAVVNRRGTTLIRDPFTAKGKTKFNFTRRSGGGIYNFEGIKLMKFASS